MSKKRKKARPPSMLLWSRAEQQRLSEAVEKIVSVSADLVEQLDTLKLHVAAIKANATRRSKSSPRPTSSTTTAQAQEIIDLRNGTAAEPSPGAGGN